jgi:hypothetical protein
MRKTGFQPDWTRLYNPLDFARAMGGFRAMPPHLARRGANAGNGELRRTFSASAFQPRDGAQ